MIRVFVMIKALVLSFLCLLGCVGLAMAEGNTPAKAVYFTSADVPPVGLGEVPPSGEQETRFFQALGETLSANGTYGLVNAPANSKYWVDAQCTGLSSCSQIKLDFYTPAHQYLSSVKIKGESCPLKQAKAAGMAQSIGKAIIEQIEAMETKGAYGTYDKTRQ
jgi:hypothetical protein